MRQAIVLADRLLGSLAGAALRHRDAGVIVLYHRVSPEPDPAYPPLLPDVFEEHCRLIRHYFTPLPPQEFLDRALSGRSLRGTCLVTFDDGYRDFVDEAYPLLVRYDIPVAHFLVTGCLSTGRPTWNLRLSRLLRAGLRPENEHGPEARPDLERRLGALPAAEREAWLAAAEERFSLPPEPAMLRPDDLHRIDRGLVTWGSHTLSHASLALLPDHDVDRELVESRRVLAGMLGHAVHSVSYPNDSWDERVERMAARAGYRAAFAVGQRKVRTPVRAMALPRFDVSALPHGMLRLELAGAVQPFRDLRG